MESSAELVQKKASHHDPGWNDPPLYSYDALNPPNAAKKTNFLNKRVAYPLATQTGTSPPTGGMNPTLPPTTKTTALPPSSLPCGLSGNRSRTSSESSGHANEPPIDKQETLSTVLTNFDCVLKRSLSMSEAERTEVKKRIGILRKMWEEDKLNSAVIRRLLELSHELNMGNIEHADHIHVGLMVDHATMCSSWMVGIRKLVQHLKTIAPPLPAITAPVASSPIPEGSFELVVQPTLPS